MKNNGIRNLKVLGASLCLSAVLLTGCGETRIQVGKSDIILEEGKTTGSISYEDIDEWVKIVSFEQNGKISYRLLAIESKGYYSSDNGYYYCRDYYDLRTGACLFEYYTYPNIKKEDEYIIGESLNLIEEIAISPYLVAEDFVQKEYTVEELLKFFDEKVLPTLKNDNKEFVK